MVYISLGPIAYQHNGMMKIKGTKKEVVFPSCMLMQYASRLRREATKEAIEEAKEAKEAKQAKEEKEEKEAEGGNTPVYGTNHSGGDDNEISDDTTYGSSKLHWSLLFADNGIPIQRRTKY